jgi:hypothetical protein
MMLSKAANQFYVNLFKCKLVHFKRWKFPLLISIQKCYFFFDSTNRREGSMEGEKEALLNSYPRDWRRLMLQLAWRGGDR